MATHKSPYLLINDPSIQRFLSDRVSIPFFLLRPIPLPFEYFMHNDCNTHARTRGCPVLSLRFHTLYCGYCVLRDLKPFPFPLVLFCTERERNISYYLLLCL